MAEHNDDMTYKSRFHFMCSCYRLPEDGSFTVGQEYAFVNTIDVVEIVDDLGQVMVFPEKIQTAVHPSERFYIERTDFRKSLRHRPSHRYFFRSYERIYHCYQPDPGKIWKCAGSRHRYCI